MRWIYCASLAAFANLLAAPAFAEGPAVWISDPRGCAPFAGVGGDGGVFMAMTRDTVLLDYWVLETGAFTCRFDTPFRLVPMPDQSEETAAVCEYADGQVVNRRLEVYYEDATHVSLSASDQTIPLYFELCRLD